MNNNIKTFEKYLESYYPPLYHSTDYLLSILKEDEIIPVTEQNLPSYPKKHKLREKNPHKNIVGISLSRDKNFTYRRDYTLFLDQNKLRNKYKLYPFDFFHDRNLNPLHRANDYKSSLESEEFLIDKSIKPLNKYLLGIRFNEFTYGRNEFTYGREVSDLSEFNDPDFKYLLNNELKKFPNIKLYDNENTDITKEYFSNKI